MVLICVIQYDEKKIIPVYEKKETSGEWSKRVLEKQKVPRFLYRLSVVKQGVIGTRKKTI